MFIDFRQREKWGHDGGRERKRERASEREIGRLLLHNLGMCPELELNLQPFVVWDDAPTN